MSATVALHFKCNQCGVEAHVDADGYRKDSKPALLRSPTGSEALVSITLAPARSIDKIDWQWVYDPLQECSFVFCPNCKYRKEVSDGKP